ncbi:unnamed protein product [Clavelina lepadiformis]|uniref:Uncharacterized protein n=1 Tax=Clavelina lepadiformis TaxID=159417 RepID=A0ABP0FV14_CLALP
MKAIVLFVCLLLTSSDARLQAALSILPDLAFFFRGDNSSLYDVKGDNFTKIADIPARFYFEGIPDEITGATNLLSDDRLDVITMLFQNETLYLVGNNVTMTKFELKDLFPGLSRTVDAAYPVVVGNRTVVGTNFIYKNTIFKCAEIGKRCTTQTLRSFTRFPREFLRDGRRIKAAFALPDGGAVLFKENYHVILKDDQVQVQRRNDDVFGGIN